uniref:Pleckstrin homology domain-containing family A member 7 n=2 Tax=Lygus hesperus TaxID=30085 RepID=A0A0A9Z874_LYGHE
MAMVKKINQRRTGGRKTTCVIQSPIVKRIHSRPVTLQGWLQKRGSDGLMLWKKRWFVLSDYCLFYYKDPEEEALLGSFVLASWIISPCTHKDKVYKKYSFKAEHNNMRTYYFAADNDVIMAQWLKALTMASLLQESPRPTSKINNSQMNQLRHKEYNIHKPPPPVGYNYGFSGGGRVMNPDNQPLYANAPPKPKRLNDGSTPDPSEEEARMSMYHEGTSSAYYDKTMNPHMVHGSYFPPPTNRSLNSNVLPINNAVANTSRAPSANVSVASHYECLRTSYTMNQISGGSHPPRPRSVDFLEYEHKHPQDVKNAFEPNIITLPRRPKSSMSISTPKEEALDSTHWSEESYAKKMRESSMYVRPDNETSTGSRAGSSQQDRDIASPTADRTDGQASSSMMIHHGQNDVSDVETNSDHNIFKRSASARLPEPEKDINESYGDGYNMSSGTTDSKKIQQREESMKRLLEWKQRMLQSPLKQKHHPEMGEIENPQSERTHRVQEIKPNLNCAHHQDPNLVQNMDKREQLELRNYSAHEHPYSTNLNVQNYNLYDFHAQSNSRMGHVEQVPRLVDNVALSSEMSRVRRNSESDSGRKAYDSSFEYPTAESNASFGGQQSSSNKMAHYTDSLEPEYSAAPKHGKLPNDFPGLREGSKSTLPYLKTCNANKTVKEISVNETDEEWGLKLDEASVVKEFSYHYIKNDGAEATFPRSKSINPSSHSEMERRQSYKFQDNLHSPQTLPENYLVNENIATKNEEVRQSPVRSKTLPVGILKNMKSKKRLDLDKGADVANSRGKWEQSFPTEVHDKRQVFSDTETLLYETSSDVDDKEKTDISNKFPNISSDDDRDEEVAAVLAKEHKLSHACLQEPTPKTPIMICSPSNNYIANGDKNIPRNNVSMSCENVAELPEENYMTMTPRKRTVSASPLKDSEQGQIGSPISNIEDSNLKGIEECPYVEMTQTGNGKTGSLSGPLQPMNHQYLNQDSTFLARTSTFSESRRVHYESEYEISGQEPLYMEVNSVDSKNHDYQGHLREKTQEVDPEEDELRDNRTVGGALPDILNTTAPSLVHHGSRRSDSSDADDEASKTWIRLMLQDILDSACPIRLGQRLIT